MMMNASLRSLLLLLLFVPACGNAETPASAAGGADAGDAPPALDAGTDVATLAAIPLVEELDYLAQLTAKRPDLYASDCYNSLVLRPEYRANLLDGKDTFDSVEARAYASDDRTKDGAWVRSMQDAQVLFCQQHPDAGACSKICLAACDACPAASLGTAIDSAPPVRPAGYPLCAFVGYLINAGPGGTPYDKSRQVLAWKVFFELGADFRTTLTAAAYLEFSTRLAAAGFRGDSKIPLQDGQVRFQYNDIIVHAYSPADARIAERVGFDLFGSSLVGHGRGLDMASATSTTGALDWHHYLCAEGPAKLSAEAIAFVRYAD